MKLDLPPFEPELAKAHTLPARFYTDPELYALERARIFARTWQPVGQAEQVRAPGDYFTSEVAGEPIVVLRDRAGELRAFFNVCRHRAGPVAVGCGTRQSLTCRYHGWTYALDGTLLTTPEFDGVECFEKKESGLLPVAVAAFGPIVFVHLSQNPSPLHSMLEQIPAETARFAMTGMTLCERREYVINCNWKVYIDNFLEGYHIPLVHPALYRELDYAEYRVEARRYHSLQHAPLRARAGSGAGPFGELPADAQALYYWVFPNWMINFYPDNLQFNAVHPLGPDRTLTVFEWYMLDTSATAAADAATARAAIAKSIAFSEQVQQEDITICEAVQKGLRSSAYDRGRFSVKRENGVHHFQSLIHEFLSQS